MNSSDKPEFSKKWWTSSKPGDIKGVDLEKALGSLEKALGEEQKRSDQDSIEACGSALEGLDSAVDKTIKKECDKKKHKDLITVLEKFSGLIKIETRRLAEAQANLKKGAADQGGDEEGEEDEEDEGKLFEKDYLYKMLKLIKSSGKELNFGFGLNTSTPEASQLLLKRKGKPEMLYKALKRTGTYSNRCLTCGTALADPEDGKVLVFRVEEGEEPPQIIKLGRRYLRGDKSLKFRKLKVIFAGGKTLVDDEPDEEDGEQVAKAGATDGEYLTQQEEAEIRKAFEGIERRVEELMAEHQVRV